VGVIDFGDGVPDDGAGGEFLPPATILDVLGVPGHTHVTTDSLQSSGCWFARMPSSIVRSATPCQAETEQ
jgi:hypothetical protein